MKKILYTITCGLLFGMSSCQDIFLDLDPLDTRTDAVYFKKLLTSKSMLLAFMGNY